MTGALVLGATLLAGCGGPLGLRLGLNPEVINALANDPAAWCIVLEPNRSVYWRDNAAERTQTELRDCLDPRATIPAPVPVVAPVAPR